VLGGAITLSAEEVLMVQLYEVEEQLKAIGCNFKFFGRPEIRELAKILLPDEKIIQCANGYYEAGIALVCVTDHRFLLVDKKPMFLTIEDVRFDMISEIDFSHKLFNATLRIHSTNKSLTFTSWNHGRLRKLVDYLQHHVAKIRQQMGQVQTHEMMQAQFGVGDMQQLQNQNQTVILPQANVSIQPIEQDQSVSMAQVAIEGFDNSQVSLPQLPVNNPYARLPQLSRRRKFPKFY
jgi:hypothetical protein